MGGTSIADGLAASDIAFDSRGISCQKLQVLPPAPRFSADDGHGEKKKRVIENLGVFFERFRGLSSNGVDE